MESLHRFGELRREKVFAENMLSVPVVTFLVLFLFFLLFFFLGTRNQTQAGAAPLSYIPFSELGWPPARVYPLSIDL